MMSVVSIVASVDLGRPLADQVVASVAESVKRTSVHGGHNRGSGSDKRVAVVAKVGVSISVSSRLSISGPLAVVVSEGIRVAIGVGEAVAIAVVAKMSISISGRLSISRPLAEIVSKGIGVAIGIGVSITIAKVAKVSISISISGGLSISGPLAVVVSECVGVVAKGIRKPVGKRMSVVAVVGVSLGISLSCHGGKEAESSDGLRKGK